VVRPCGSFRPWKPLWIVQPVALTLAMVGLIESLLTASIVDEMTDTPSDKNRESRGQGIANIVSGCFGGMAGCAMIGQSVIIVRSATCPMLLVPPSMWAV
jgi:sulfate permease, SulP family